ncbi:MAG: NADPH-dependent F420 reductase, partial [Nitriliruptoraceae bacterium]|nr:NADPH-dependent F420 reductase [Nitriliruptoraceae bacterium]
PRAGGGGVSCVTPRRFFPAGPHPVAVPEVAAALAAAARVPDARVVAAFHHVPAAAVDADGPLHDATVLVVGADPEARAVIVGLAATVASGGGVDAGPLRHAATLEAMTAVLIEVNRRHDAHAGLAVTGLPDRAG